MLKENIKTLRKSKGLSQEELAIKLNVVRQTISKWEQGLSVPDAEMLIKLAEVLDTNVSTLLGEKITEQMLQKIPGSLIIKINQAVGFRLLTKFGTKGIINLWKVIPLIPGIINGALDVRYTTLIGNKAKDLFTDISTTESKDDYIDITSESIPQ